MSDWLQELSELEHLKASWERRETNSYQPYRKAVLNHAGWLIELARRAEELEREVERLQSLNDNREAMLKHWQLNQRVLHGHMTTEQMHAELAEAHPRQYGNLV